MKYILDEEYDYDFRVIGVSCHEKDYRICWGLNQQLCLFLSREEEDLEVAIKKSNRFSSHSLYSYIDKDTENEYSLLANRSNMGFLIPEQAHADYLLLIKESYPVNFESMIGQIKLIPFVLTAFEIDVFALKSKENLIF